MALEIFIPNTGQGDCTLIKFPNGKNMLIDFNKTETDVDIIELLREKVPYKKHTDIDKTCRRINYFINTHPHDDHLKGIKNINDDEFYIDEIWESGHRLYVPKKDQKDYQNYYDFLDLVNKLKKRNSVKKMRASRTPSYIGTTKIYCFSPSSYLVDSNSRSDIHKQCAVLKIEYMGNSILFAGDTNRDSWEDRIVPYYSDDKLDNGKPMDNLLSANVLHASHHGSKYFFVEKDDDSDRYIRAMDKIKPSFTCISVGSGNRHGHPHRIAVNIYKDNTKYKRVWKTKDNKSMYFAFKNDGKIEYKKDLDSDELSTIKYKTEESNILKSSAATFTFAIDDEIELELPKRPPKPKREGYR